MQIDDYTLRQAADSVHSALRKFQVEPSVANRQELVTVCRHYTTSGVVIRLKPDAVIVQRKETLSA